MVFLNPWQWEVGRQEEEHKLQEESLLCRLCLLRLFILPICCIWFHCPRGSFLFKKITRKPYGTEAMNVTDIPSLL